MSIQGIVSIAVAILALIGTIANAALLLWEKSHAEKRKRYFASADAVAKYRNSLHLAAEDLSSKIINLIDNGYAWWVSEAAGRLRQEYAIIHTSFLFGQFLCWLYILRRETQLLLPSTQYDAESRTIRTILNNIRQILRTSKDDSLFPILTGEQEAIGELMTVMEVTCPEEEGMVGGGMAIVRSGGHYRCMGYASFVQRWKNDTEFREWFRNVANGLKEMDRIAQGTRSGLRLPRRQHPPDERLRRLQHQLVDLIECLDPRGLLSKAVHRCMLPARECVCKSCVGRQLDGQGAISSGTKLHKTTEDVRSGIGANKYEAV